MQTFAVIPAAGRSLRMGRPKLLLPWGDGALIEHVIATWRASQVRRIVVVAHPDDSPLARLAQDAGAEVVQPSDAPPDMKASVRVALEHLSASHPAEIDAWLLAPGDLPGLTVATINRVIDAYRQFGADRPGPPPICVASFRGRRGHPALFPWPLAAEVANLAAGDGLNTLLARHEVRLIPAGEDAISADVDTPEDYADWQARPSS